MASDEIYKYLYDDYDDDWDGEEGIGCELDTRWIHEIETQLICDDYSEFIKTDITSVSFEFVYLGLRKEIVNIDRCVLPLMKPNTITQNEIFQLIQKKQRLVVGRKYYNFMSLCFYHFYINDDPKSVSQYLYSGGRDDDDNDEDCHGGNITEYTNILSIETIYFQPMIRMFHDMNCFTVVLFED